MDLVLYRCVRFGCLCDHRILCNGIEWNVVIVGIYFTCMEARVSYLRFSDDLKYVYVISFFFDIWKLLVAYKHTYFVQRNRMKCGHSRNLFYVSRSCFSFYLHTFVTHLNNWNTPLRFHFYSTFENYLWHINTLILYNGIEWNVVIVGIYFTCLEAVLTVLSFYLHTFVTHLNKWNTRWDFIFIRHLKTTCGI